LVRSRILGQMNCTFSFPLFVRLLLFALMMNEGGGGVEGWIW
jgi:hypothetical protein